MLPKKKEDTIACVILAAIPPLAEISLAGWFGVMFWGIRCILGMLAVRSLTKSYTVAGRSTPESEQMFRKAKAFQIAEFIMMPVGIALSFVIALCGTVLDIGRIG